MCFDLAYVVRLLFGFLIFILSLFFPPNRVNVPLTVFLCSAWFLSFELQIVCDSVIGWWSGYLQLDSYNSFMPLPVGNPRLVVCAIFPPPFHSILLRLVVRVCAHPLIATQQPSGLDKTNVQSLLAVLLLLIPNDARL